MLDAALSLHLCRSHFSTSLLMTSVAGYRTDLGIDFSYCISLFKHSPPIVTTLELCPHWMKLVLHLNSSYVGHQIQGKT